VARNRQPGVVTHLRSGVATSTTTVTMSDLRTSTSLDSLPYHEILQSAYGVSLSAYSWRAMSSLLTMPTQSSSAAFENTALLPNSKAAASATRKFVGDAPQVHLPVGRARYGFEAFFADLQDLAGGTLPVSVVIAITIGVICGVVACVYYMILEFFLTLIWTTIPKYFIEGNPHWPSSLHWAYIPLVGISMAAFVGMSVNILGEPGDLAYTVGCVHKAGYIATDHVMPMVFASLFSIIGGGSLGPEAPLVAICGSIGGWVSRVMFKQHYKNIVRKHTLNGMVSIVPAIGIVLFLVS
jgi:hypothetical protein